jgi:hydroxymethylpyrimidine pyrophosphatase-like HAD family hydrolase
MIIAVDFDGTCVTHDFPNEGQSVGGEETLKELVKNGHKLILYTMRSGATLETAIQWFLKNGISLYGIQYNPEQARWTSSNKCYAQLYIDDAALGCPLRFDEKSERPYVDWSLVRVHLKSMNLI